MDLFYKPCTVTCKLCDWRKLNSSQITLTVKWWSFRLWPAPKKTRLFVIGFFLVPFRTWTAPRCLTVSCTYSSCIHHRVQLLTHSDYCKWRCIRLPTCYRQFASVTQVALLRCIWKLCPPKVGASPSQISSGSGAPGSGWTFSPFQGTAIFGLHCTVPYSIYSVPTVTITVMSLHISSSSPRLHRIERHSIIVTIYPDSCITM